MKRLPGALGLGAFCVYAWFAAPGMYWLDAGELGSAAVRLGVPHPTGFPLFTFAGYFAGWIPIAELAFRLHLLCAASAAVAVGLVARLVLDLAGEDRVGGVAATVAAIVLGSSLTFFRHATATEVYAPTAAAVALASIWALRGKHLLSLAFFSGLAATGLHGSFRLLLIVPVVALFLWRYLRGARWLAAAPFLAVLGAAGILLYLPVRSASGRAAAVDWGHTRRAGPLVDHVLARRIQRAYEQEMFSARSTPENFRAFLRLVEEDLGALALVGAAGGLLFLAWRRRGAAAGLLGTVALFEIAYAVWLNPMGTRDRQNGVFLALAASALCGAGAAAGARKLGRAAPFAAGALGLIVAVEPVLHGAEERLGTARSEVPRAWAEAALQGLPPRAIALLRSDDLAAGLYWLTLAEPIRPDVAALVRQHLWDAARTRALTGAGKVAEIRDRPVGWEIGDDRIPSAARLDLPMARIGGVGVADATPLLRRIFDDVGDPETRRVARRAWNNLSFLESLRGDPAAAAAAAEVSIELGDDAGARVNAARYRLALGDDRRAREHAARAIEIEPERAAAWALLGTVEARARRCAQAREAFARALEIDPDEPDAKVNAAKPCE